MAPSGESNVRVLVTSSTAVWRMRRWGPLVLEMYFTEMKVSASFSKAF